LHHHTCEKLTRLAKLAILTIVTPSMMVSMASCGRFCQFFHFSDSLFSKLINDESLISIGYAHSRWWRSASGERGFFAQGQNRPHRGFKPAACFDIWLAAFHIMEMLYDTPFPTEPQNDLVPAQTERNEEIRARYEAGETGVSIAQTFGISEQRVNQIIRGRRS
jgi:hypothetical protein